MTFQTVNIVEYLQSDASALKNVGVKNYQKLINLLSGKAGSVTFFDLISHLPVRLIERTLNPDNLYEVLNKNVIIEAEVRGFRQVGRAKSVTVVNLLYIPPNIDIKVKLQAIFFNAGKYLQDALRVGNIFTFVGELRYEEEYKLLHPQIIYSKDNIESLQKELVYPLAKGISNKFLSGLIRQVIGNIPKSAEWADEYYIKYNSLPTFDEAITKIHSEIFFETDIYKNKNRQRLAYDEFLAEQLTIAISRNFGAEKRGIKFNNTKEEIFSKITQSLPFELTGDQQKVIGEIKSDLGSDKRMFRLVQGDVGCGKTIVAFYALCQAVENNYQAAYMAPTELLAKQIYAEFCKLIDSCGYLGVIQPVLLIGSLTVARKKKIQQAISSGKYDIVIGTHSLFQDAVSFHNLGVSVIDEQHRFGVKQRLALLEKDGGVNSLFLSATPIPRTLWMSLCGDMDVSIIAQKPSIRQKIDTKIISEDKITNLIESLNNVLSKGELIYWVCPMIDEEDDEIKNRIDSMESGKKYSSVVERAKSLQRYYGRQVGVVHGKMKADEKDKIFQSFLKHETKILVATTVIEVGINVPDATVIIIENAEHFGLAQLHQLRGRVGRSDKKSNCILLYSNNISQNGRKRLNALRDSDDGFKIAEEDLAIRGTGDISGVAQSGFKNYHFAIMPNDKELLFAAADDAKNFLHNKENFTKPRAKHLRKLLEIFGYNQSVKYLGA